jgi:phosphatidate cytidylyltransferase
VTTAAPSAPSKGSKLWRRTRVGGTIAAGLAGVLWLTTLFHSELPMLALAAAVLAVCIWEVDRMGSLRGRGLWAPLTAGALAAIWVTLVFFHADAGIDLENRKHVDLGHASLWLVWAGIWSGLAITAVYALACTRSIVVRVAGALLAAAPFLTERHTPIDGVEIAAAVLLLFIVLRLTVFGAERRGEALSVLLLGPLLAVSIVGLVWVWYDYTHWGLVALLAISKIGDTAGYYVGSTLGRHHPFKSISPGKTTEGCLGSLVASSLACVGAVELGWLPGASWVGGLAAGAAVNLAAQASDLLESWVKRKAGVKDSGAWFGPSGGMLDLVDSFFLASPVALVVWPLVLNSGHA